MMNVSGGNGVEIGDTNVERNVVWLGGMIVTPAGPLSEKVSALMVGSATVNEKTICEDDPGASSLGD
jgi:hypothetical protein